MEQIGFFASNWEWCLLALYVVEKAINTLTINSDKKSHLIYMSPSGKPLIQNDLMKFCKKGI